jgi:putative phosphoesterase
MVAVLYDIHGNAPALEAVLDEARASGARQVIIGGDVVPGPMPAESLAMLRALEIPTQCIRGNGDRVVLAARRGEDISSEVPEAFRDVIYWNAQQIDDDTAAWMTAWPTTLQLQTAHGGRVLFCHATPQNDTDVFTAGTQEQHLLPLFRTVDADLVVCGHTHMQFDRRVGVTRVVNAGSVGMSFQGPGAYWLSLAAEVHLRRTDYDLDRAAARIRTTHYPQAESFAMQNVLATPLESVMTEVFAAAERQWRARQ